MCTETWRRNVVYNPIYYLGGVSFERCDLRIFLRMGVLNDVGLGSNGPPGCDTSNAIDECICAKRCVCASVLWDPDGSISVCLDDLGAGHTQKRFTVFLVELDFIGSWGRADDADPRSYE